MWGKVLSICMGLSVVACAESGPKRSVDFAEGYVKYDPRNGATEIILYEYSTAKGVELTTNTVAAALGLEGFAVSEVMFAPDGSKAVRILARAQNFMRNATVEQLFSALIGAPAKVGLEGPPPTMSMRLILSAPERFYVADNNATEQLANEDKTQIMLTFDISDQPISVVFGWAQPETPMEKMDREYQQDADIFRLRHLQYYAGLINEFHEKTGRYPLQGVVEYPNYVFLAAPHQEQYVQGTPPYEHKVTPLDAFRAELEKGLGRAVDLKFDPQKVPVTAPNFYIYMMDGDTYYLAVHLYGAQPFAKPLGKHFNKLEIMNGPTQGNGLWNADDLMKDETFNAAAGATATKEGFFLSLENEFK